MEKIGLIVDTAGDLPREIVEEYNIVEVPFYLYFEGEENIVYKETILPIVLLIYDITKIEVEIKIYKSSCKILSFAHLFIFCLWIRKNFLVFSSISPNP